MQDGLHGRTLDNERSFANRRTSKVKDLPLIVAGPPAATAQLTTGLSATGMFDITSATEREAAVVAIEERNAYGAIIAGPGGVEVLTATAASPIAAQAITGVAQKLAAQAAQQAQATGAEAPSRCLPTAPLRSLPAPRRLPGVGSASGATGVGLS